LRIYDRNVNLAKLVGANRDFILNHIPHIARIMVGSIEEVVHHASTIVIGNRDPEFAKVFEISGNRHVVDFVRIADKSSGGSYEGICW
jgi:GDP-mannose 6-dehydrogenase